MALAWTAVETMIRNLLIGSSASNPTQAKILERFNLFYRDHFVKTDRSVKYLQKSPTDIAIGTSTFPFEGQYEIHDFIELRVTTGSGANSETDDNCDVPHRVSYDEMQNLQRPLFGITPNIGQMRSVLCAQWRGIAQFYTAFIEGRPMKDDGGGGWVPDKTLVRRWTVSIFPPVAAVSSVAAFCRVYPRPVDAATWVNFEVPDDEVVVLAHRTAKSLLTEFGREDEPQTIDSIALGMDGIEDSQKRRTVIDVADPPARPIVHG